MINGESEVEDTPNLSNGSCALIASCACVEDTPNLACICDGGGGISCNSCINSSSPFISSGSSSINLGACGLGAIPGGGGISLDELNEDACDISDIGSKEEDVSDPLLGGGSGEIEREPTDPVDSAGWGRAGFGVQRN